MNNELLLKAISEAEQRDAIEMISEKCKYPYEVSNQFKQKISQLIQKQRKPYFYLINTVGKRIACMIIALFVVMTTTVMSVEALRVPVIRFIIETFEKFTSIDFGSDSETIVPETIETKYEPEYIPAGYNFVNENSSDMLVKIIYQNEAEDQIIFKQTTLSNVSMNIDTEGTVTENIVINNYTAIYYSNKGINSIIWSDENYSYNVHGKIDKKELLKMADSTKIEKQENITKKIVPQ